MTLRITQATLYRQTLNNLRAAAERSLGLQIQVATGKRVNRPSDDPAATLRILPLRSEILGLDSSVAILDNTRDAINVASSVLNDVSSVVQRLRELTVQAASSTVTATDRANMATEVDQLLNQVLAGANTRFSERYLFAGTHTETTPFSLEQSSTGTRVVYHGGTEPAQLQTPVGVSTEFTLAGDATFLSRHRQPTSFSGTTGAAPSGAADSGIGVGDLDVAFDGLVFAGGTTGIAQGDQSTTALGPISYAFAAGAPPTLSLNGGPPQPITGGVQSFTVGNGSTTVSLNISGAVNPPSGTLVSTATLSTDQGASTVRVDFTGTTEFQVRNSNDGTVLNVDTSNLSRVGREVVTYHGTFDIFTTLIEVRDLLRNDAGLPDTEVQQRLSSLLDEIDSAHGSILDGLQDLGHRSQGLDLLANRLDGLSVSRQESLSKVEDAELAETIVEWNKQTLNFQASLQVGARAITTTLMDFLR